MAAPIDLVTGATGLLGGNLARLLAARGGRVRALVRPGSNSRYLSGVPGIELVQGSLGDLDSLRAACRGARHLYHCAAVVSMWPGRGAEMRLANVGGTAKVIQAAEEAAVERLIYCSSVDAIGLPTGPEPSDESAPWNWDLLGVDNPYARTKYEAQQLVLKAAQGGIDAVVVNPSYVFGPFDLAPSSGQMILSVARGAGLFYPGGSNNFVDAGDAARGMILAAEKGRSGELYILGHENMSYRQIFQLIAEITGAPPPRFPLPRPLARVGGWLADGYGRLSGREPLISSVSVKLGYTDHRYSAAKAVGELGMPQRPVSEAVERAYRWFLEVGMLAR